MHGDDADAHRQGEGPQQFGQLVDLANCVVIGCAGSGHCVELTMSCHRNIQHLQTSFIFSFITSEYDNFGEVC